MRRPGSYRQRIGRDPLRGLGNAERNRLVDVGFGCAFARTAELGLLELVDACRDPRMSEEEREAVVAGFVAGVKLAASEGKSWP